MRKIVMAKKYGLLQLDDKHLWWNKGHKQDIFCVLVNNKPNAHCSAHAWCQRSQRSWLSFLAGDVLQSTKHYLWFEWSFAASLWLPLSSIPATKDWAMRDWNTALTQQLDAFVTFMGAKWHLPLNCLLWFCDAVWCHFTQKLKNKWRSPTSCNTQNARYCVW